MILSSVMTHDYSLRLCTTVLAAVAYVWPALRANQLGMRASALWVASAWLLHGVSLALGLFGSPAYFGFAPALSATFWLVGAGYALESHFYRVLPARWALGALGSVVVLLALAFPGAALPQSASIWLPLHLVLALACYGLFGTAVLHAWFMQRMENRIRLAADTHSGISLLALERLTYRFVAIGFMLLTLTLLVGVVFGEIVFGHAPRWNHKTVFSILSWLTFATLLAGRWTLGWRGKRAARVLYTGAAFLLLAYVGSRFVMEVILERTP